MKAVPNLDQDIILGTVLPFIQRRCAIGGGATLESGGRQVETVCESRGGSEKFYFWRVRGDFGAERDRERERECVCLERLMDRILVYREGDSALGLTNLTEHSIR